MQNKKHISKHKKEAVSRENLIQALHKLDQKNITGVKISIPQPDFYEDILPKSSRDGILLGETSLVDDLYDTDEVLISLDIC